MFFKRRTKSPPAFEPLSASNPSPARSATSVLGKNTRFRGEVRGRGPLSVRGQVKGIVAIDERLSIENGGLLEAEAVAADMIVAGQARGTLRVRGVLVVRSTGQVEGTLRAARLRIEHGAIVRGTVTRGDAGD